MLDRLHKYAFRLRWLRLPLVYLSVMAIVLAGYVTIFPVNPGESVNDSLFIPALLLFCWSILAFSLINVFQVAPPTVDSKLGFFRRQAAKFRRALRSIIALGFLLLSIALAVVSIKLMTTGLG